MIVQCPGCASRYRVNDAKIPPSGGKIRCPSCTHSFVIFPETSAESVTPGEETEGTSVREQSVTANLPGDKHQQEGWSDDDETASTEVMAGSGMPDFSALFGGAPPEGDKTVEMSNPLFNKMLFPDRKKKQESKDDDATAELNSDIVDASLQRLRRETEQAESVEPQDRELSHEPAPSMVNHLPSPQTLPPSQTQRRGSGPRETTPPPFEIPAPRASSSSPPTPSTPSPQSRPPPTPGDRNTPLPPSSGPDSGRFGASPMPSSGSGANESGADHQGPWKLQTNFGLTYEFADNISLKSWLESRDDLDGYKLSVDGEDFFELSQFPQINNANLAGQSGGNRAMASSGSHPAMPRPEIDNPRETGNAGAEPGTPITGRSPSTPPPSGGFGFDDDSISPFTTAEPAVSGSISGPGRPAKEKIDPDNAYRPPSRDSAVLNILLGGAFVILTAAAVALALHIGGVIDLFGDQTPAVTEPEVMEDTGEASMEAAAADSEIDQAEQARQMAARNAQEVERILDSARQDLESNRLSSALDSLQAAQALDPQRIQVYDMQADIYEMLDQTDDAEEMRERARMLRLDSEGVTPPSLPEDE